MKKLFLLSIVALMGPAVFAQHSLEKIWESDSLTLKSPESVFYDAKSNSLYVSSMGAGAVVQMDLTGKIIKSDWVTGLSGNMGSALFNGILYIAEGGGVTAIDASKATVIKKVPIEGAGMLNDVVVDAKGNIYVSDTRSGKVYRIENDKPQVYVENIPGANGLMFVGTDLYVVGSATICKVSAAKEMTTVAEGFENGLDGIVKVGNNEFIVSNFQGILYYLHADGTKQVLLDGRASRTMANDISYNEQTKTLYVPSFRSNRVIAYKVK